MKPIACPLALMALVFCSVIRASSATVDPLANWHIRSSPNSPTSENYEGVAFGNGRWVVVGDEGTILSSPDGVDWNLENNPAAPSRLDDVAFGNGVFVAIGRGPKMVLTSPDGQTWTKREPALSGCMEVIFDGTRFTALLSGGFIAVSTNGADWAQPARVPVKNDVGGLAFGNGTHVEVGYKKTGFPPEVFSSIDFTNWVPRDSKLSENLMNVGFGLGLFIAVGQGGSLATSPDGIEWTPRTVPHTGFIWDVALGAGHLVAAAQWGRLLTSTNGINWTRRETELPWHLTDVAYGDGSFVAVGWDGQLLQSDPLQATAPGNSLRISNCRRDSGQFSFTFNGVVGKAYQVQISSDLHQWAPLASVQCTQTPTTFSDSSTTSPRFYRLVQQ